MTKPTNCPKCQGSMTQGFISDYFHDYKKGVLSWFEGPPKSSFWTGTKGHHVDAIPIGVFRCQQCGCLEFYANPEFAAK